MLLHRSQQLNQRREATPMGVGWVKFMARIRINRV